MPEGYARTSRVRLALCTALIAVGLAGPARADVSNVTITDVTTRAFSVVWTSSETVSTATVRVFQDASGTVAVPGLNVGLLSDTDALERGVVKVDVVGLEADTTVYVETETTGLAGPPVIFPEAPAALLTVTTQLATTKATPAGAPIANDLLLVQVPELDPASTVDGTLVLVSAPGISEYPVSAFVGKGIASPSSLVDLNNLFDATSRTSADIPAGTVLEIAAFRGLPCGPADQALLRVRLAPTGEAITELAPPGACFAPDGVPADIDCDDRVSLSDLTRLLGRLDIQSSDCRYAADLDVTGDGQIDLADYQQLITVLGREP